MSINKWIVYTLTLGFAAYWASNLILWFPWSYSAILGITLMLTLVPFLWAYVTFLALKTYPEESLLKGSSIIAVIFLLIAVIMDYIFFGLIRNAMEDLYHPTTFYGYGFLIIWPFLLALIFKKKIIRLNKTTTNPDISKAAISGLICFGALTLIIILDISIWNNKQNAITGGRWVCRPTVGSHCFESVLIGEILLMFTIAMLAVNHYEEFSTFSNWHATWCG